MFLQIGFFTLPFPTPNQSKTPSVICCWKASMIFEKCTSQKCGFGPQKPVNRKLVLFVQSDPRNDILKKNIVWLKMAQNQQLQRIYTLTDILQTILIFILYFQMAFPVRMISHLVNMTRAPKMFRATVVVQLLIWLIL